jgi:hypothetical protein
MFWKVHVSDFITDVSTNIEPKENRYNNVKFKAVNTVNTNITAFCDVTP